MIAVLMVLPLKVLLSIVEDFRSSSLHSVLVILSILCPLFFRPNHLFSRQANPDRFVFLPLQNTWMLSLPRSSQSGQATSG